MCFRESRISICETLRSAVPSCAAASLGSPAISEPLLLQLSQARVARERFRPSRFFFRNLQDYLLKLIDNCRFAEGGQKSGNFLVLSRFRVRVLRLNELKRAETLSRSSQEFLILRQIRAAHFFFYVQQN